MTIPLHFPFGAAQQTLKSIWAFDGDVYCDVVDDVDADDCDADVSDADDDDVVGDVDDDKSVRPAQVSGRPST